MISECCRCSLDLLTRLRVIPRKSGPKVEETSLRERGRRGKRFTRRAPRGKPREPPRGSERRSAPRSTFIGARFAGYFASVGWVKPRRSTRDGGPSRRKSRGRPRRGFTRGIKSRPGIYRRRGKVRRSRFARVAGRREILFRDTRPGDRTTGVMSVSPREPRRTSHGCESTMANRRARALRLRNYVMLGRDVLRVQPETLAAS